MEPEIFIPEHIKVCYQFLPSAGWNESTLSCNISLIHILLLSCHLDLGLPSDLFYSGFPTKTLYSSLFSLTCSTYVILPHLTTLMPITILTVHLSATERATADIGLDSGICTPHSFIRLFSNYKPQLLWSIVCVNALYLHFTKIPVTEFRLLLWKRSFQRNRKHGVFSLHPLKSTN